MSLLNWNQFTANNGKAQNMVRQSIPLMTPAPDPDPSARLETATDLSPLVWQNAIVLLDEQNLSIGAGNMGFHLDYRLLADKIRSAAASAKLHIFTAADKGDTRPASWFGSMGFVVHVKTIRHRPTTDGRQRRDTNADNLFAFWAGLLAVRSSDRVVVLGSGDFGLAGEIAEAIRSQRPAGGQQIMTLSLPGSTARDLDTRGNLTITANVKIGLDVPRPSGSPVQNPRATPAGVPQAFAPNGVPSSSPTMFTSFKPEIRRFCCSARHPSPVEMRFQGTCSWQGQKAYRMRCPDCRRRHLYVYTINNEIRRVA